MMTVTVDVEPRDLPPIHLRVDRDRVTPVRRTVFLKDERGEIYGKTEWAEGFDAGFYAWASEAAAALAERAANDAANGAAAAVRRLLRERGHGAADARAVLAELRAETRAQAEAAWEPHYREQLLRSVGAYLDQQIADALAEQSE